MQRIALHALSDNHDYRPRPRLPGLARPSPGDRIRLFPFHTLSRRSDGSAGCTKYMSMDGLRRTLRVAVGDKGLE
jgi:hypothetical protein